MEQRSCRAYVVKVSIGVWRGSDSLTAMCAVTRRYLECADNGGALDS
jgi:hypothetical protein